MEDLDVSTCGLKVSFWNLPYKYNWIVASKFMSALGQDGTINEESLSQAELGRVYGPLREQVTDSIHRQETVLANLQVMPLQT